MKSITLISDWKIRDPYISMFKGSIYSMLPDATIFDITHAISPFHLEQTAFILKNSYAAFPLNSLHIILTATSFSPHERPIIVFYNNHAFLGADTGIFSILFDKEINVHSFQYPQTDESAHAPYMDKILQMIQWFVEGTIEKNTIPYPNFVFRLKRDVMYIEKENRISGNITYIDSFFNAVTNIPTSFFKEKRKNRSFSTRIPSSPYLNMNTFHDFYNEKEAEPYFVSNRLGFLEITMYQSHVATLGNLKIGEEIDILFHEF